MHVNEVYELFIGYSNLNPVSKEMKANGSSTLIKSKNKIIVVDCLSPWDADLLISQLKFHHVKPEDVDYLVCTHGHSDHTGNMNLFLNATHFVGSCISHRNDYNYHDFSDKPYVLDENIEVIFTPGHTSTCVSIIAKHLLFKEERSLAIVGDLFEKEEDIFDESIWINAGTEDEKAQRKNRLKVAEMVDFIIPGHGPQFELTAEHRQKLREDAEK